MCDLPRQQAPSSHATFANFPCVWHKMRVFGMIACLGGSGWGKRPPGGREAGGSQENFPPISSSNPTLKTPTFKAFTIALGKPGFLLVRVAHSELQLHIPKRCVTHLRWGNLQANSARDPRLSANRIPSLGEGAQRTHERVRVYANCLPAAERLSFSLFQRFSPREASWGLKVSKLLLHRTLDKC